MNIRKLLCLVLTLVFCCAGALAEGDLQAQLDAANAKIAELQAQVDKYYPYYMAQIAATYGEDGVIWAEDIRADYEAEAQMYASYGLDLASMGLDVTLKQGLVYSAVEKAVLMEKAAELGLDQLDEETLANLEETTRSTLDSYVEYYISYFYPDAAEVTDDMRAEAEAYWATSGMDYESSLAAAVEATVLELVNEYVIADLSVSEEEIQAEYEGLLAADEESYSADPASYGNMYNNGASVAWIPEGYRAVKHVLVGFDDAQSARYSELNTMVQNLNAELEALANPEEGVEYRSEEEITAELTACAVEIEAMYAALLPTAEEVVEKFNAGADFDSLIAEYNSDPGMLAEPTATNGYAVSAASTNWDPAFQEAAMSIAEVGGISEPAYGSYGIYVVYYLKDITPGAVALEEIYAEVADSALANKQNETYDAQVTAWIEEANAVFYYENV